MSSIRKANLITIAVIVILAYFAGVVFASFIPGDMPLMDSLGLNLNNTTDEKLLIIGDNDFDPVTVKKPIRKFNYTNNTSFNNTTYINNSSYKKNNSNNNLDYDFD